MCAKIRPRIDPNYRKWQTSVVRVGDRDLTLVTKPGVVGHTNLDVSSILLAEHVHAKSGDIVAHLNCGNGLLGTALGSSGQVARILLADRNVLSVEAAARTIKANGVARVETHLGHGRAAFPRETRCDIVAIRIPHERLAVLQLLYDAFGVLNVGGECYIAGGTREGIKTAARTMEQIFGNAHVVATDSGYRVVLAIKSASLPASPDTFDSPFLQPDTFNEFDMSLRGRSYKSYTRPGVFSWDHVDEATAILAECMVVRPGDRVLDLGCGAGPLGIVASALTAPERITMVDADSEAVRSARKSADAAGAAAARVLVSDVASAVLDESFDLVVTNPPFHVGKATDLTVPMQFMQDSWTVLATGGRLNLVANRTLPYEGAIKWRFGNVAMVHDGRRFKVLTAIKGSATPP